MQYFARGFEYLTANINGTLIIREPASCVDIRQVIMAQVMGYIHLCPHRYIFIKAFKQADGKDILYIKIRRAVIQGVT